MAFFFIENFSKASLFHFSSVNLAEKIRVPKDRYLYADTQQKVFKNKKRCDEEDAMNSSPQKLMTATCQKETLFSGRTF